MFNDTCFATSSRGKSPGWYGHDLAPGSRRIDRCRRNEKIYPGSGLFLRIEAAWTRTPDRTSAVNKSTAPVAGKEKAFVIKCAPISDEIKISAQSNNIRSKIAPIKPPTRNMSQSCDAYCAKNVAAKPTANRPPATKPDTPIASFCKNSASNAPTKPSRSAKVNCNNGVGSLTTWEARTVPAANPIAATQSQKSLRPNIRTTAPITALRTGMERFKGTVAPKTSIVVARLAGRGVAER